MSSYPPPDITPPLCTFYSQGPTGEAGPEGAPGKDGVGGPPGNAGPKGMDGLNVSETMQLCLCNYNDSHALV